MNSEGTRSQLKLERYLELYVLHLASCLSHLLYFTGARHDPKNTWSDAEGRMSRGRIASLFEHKSSHQSVGGWHCPFFQLKL